ncbi:hypothetical protein ACHAXS_003860 [Conticribra weissflogii]
MANEAEVSKGMATIGSPRPTKKVTKSVGIITAAYIVASSADLPTTLGHQLHASVDPSVQRAARSQRDLTDECSLTTPKTTNAVIQPHRRNASTCMAIPRGGSSTETAAEVQLEIKKSDKSDVNITAQPHEKRKKKKKTASPKSNKQQSDSSSRSQVEDKDNTNFERFLQEEAKQTTMKTSKNSKPDSNARMSASSNLDEDDSSNQSNQNSGAADTTAKSKIDRTPSSQQTLPPAAQSILRQKCYYDILGITKEATQVEIQKAYRKRCVLTHPDKIPSGDRAAFDKVSEAYEVLSCEKKRSLYDRFGKEGVDNGGPTGMGGAGGSFFGNDVFRDFFGFPTSSASTDPFSGRNRSFFSASSGSSFRRPPRNRDLRYQLEVTLEDLYNGSTKHIAIQQPNPLRPQFPLRKEVEVTLCPGMSSGESVKLAGVVDSIPDAAPADVVFLLSQRRHAVFTRRGHDLAMECKISFGEALVGFKRKILHLDGREILIAPPMIRKNEHNGPDHNVTSIPISEDEKTTQLPSVIVQTGDVHVLKGEGMPKRRTGEHGDLYIQYVVEMPGSTAKLQSSNLNDEERRELARLLQKLEGRDDHSINEYDDNSPVHQLSIASASDFGRASSTDHDNVHDEHLQHDEDLETNARHGFRNPEDVHDFFQRAFTGRTQGFGGSPFTNDSGGTFHYFSSSGGGGFGPSPFFNGPQSSDDDHKVECNQM